LIKYLLFTVFLSSAIIASFAQGKVYTVAFYNVENLFDTLDDPGLKDEEFTPAGRFKYTDKIYRQKLRNIARVLGDMGTGQDADGADIIGFAEVENERVLKDLAAQPTIARRKYKHVWFKSPDIRGISTAMFYNPAHFKLLTTRPLVVAQTAEPTRSVLYVSGVLAGDTVHVLVNHWPSRREGMEKTEPERKLAAIVNKTLVDSLELAEPAQKVIIMGDFNDNPDNESIAQILNAGTEVENDFFNPWLDIFRLGTGTVLYKKHWDLFDQVLLSPTFISTRGLTFLNAEIFKKAYLVTQNGNFKGYPHRSFGGTRWLNGYSDHLPVLIYLSYTNK
jgi:endonuclease/exonuclease/phosphatase family metal-dependent hydrolase